MKRKRTMKQRKKRKKKKAKIKKNRKRYKNNIKRCVCDKELTFLDGNLCYTKSRERLVKMSNKVSFSNVLVLDGDEPIHEWILRDFGSRKNMSVREIPISKIKNSRLQYASILSKKEIVYITGDDEKIASHLEYIGKMNRKRRMLAVDVKRSDLVGKLEKRFGKSTIKRFPSVRAYEDRLAVVSQILNRKGVECESKAVMQQLKKNMARSALEWEDVFLMWEVKEVRGEVMQQVDIDELFIDNDFNNLSKFIFKVFKGSVKHKNHKTLSYFLDVKEY